MTETTDETPTEAAISEGLDRAETLLGDIRDTFLRVLQSQSCAWDELKESEQEDLIERIEHVAEKVIFDAISIVHAEGAPSLTMTVTGVAFKKGVGVTLIGTRDEPNRHLLADMVERSVLVVLDDRGKFMGESEPAATQPDQRDLVETEK